jgi:hypothetical protein
MFPRRTLLRLDFLAGASDAGLNLMKCEIPDRRRLILAVSVARLHVGRFEGADRRAVTSDTG